jgi:hypothetical protein
LFPFCFFKSISGASVFRVFTSVQPRFESVFESLDGQKGPQAANSPRWAGKRPDRGTSQRLKGQRLTESRKKYSVEMHRHQIRISPLPTSLRRSTHPVTPRLTSILSEQRLFTRQQVLLKHQTHSPAALALHARPAISLLRGPSFNRPACSSPSNVCPPRPQNHEDGTCSASLRSRVAALDWRAATR